MFVFFIFLDAMQPPGFAPFLPCRSMPLLFVVTFRVECTKDIKLKLYKGTSVLGVGVPNSSRVNRNIKPRLVYENF